MLYFITGNAGKLRGVQAVIPEIVQLDLAVDEIQSMDPQVVIEHKLEQAAAKHSGEFIVDDTTLIFECIKPLPGTMIKWFEQSLGVTGMSELVLRYSDHSALMRVTIGYRAANGATYFFASEYRGTIVSPRGDAGFGFDSIFIAHGQTKTNAELTTDEKDAFSARGKAARQLAAHLIKFPRT